MLDFARAGETIRATSSKLEKTRVLSDYLRALEPDDLRRAVLYITGRALPPSDARVLNLGAAALFRVISQMTGLSAEELSSIYRRHQDPGDWTFEVLQGKTNPRPYSLREIGGAFDAIEASRSMAAKQEVLTGLLSELDALSARYVIKILSGEMRIGLQEGLVEDAVASAFDVPALQIRRVHMLTGDLGETALLARAGQVESATIQLFKPVRYMLASPVATAAEAMMRVGAAVAWTEEKYDGVRCQLH